MTDINTLVYEGLGNHLKKHWKKYALGGLLAGAGALAYDDHRGAKKVNKGIGHAATISHGLITAADRYAAVKAAGGDNAQATLAATGHGLLNYGKAHLVKAGVDAMIKNPDNRNKMYGALLGLDTLHRGSNHLHTIIAHHLSKND